MTQPSNPRDTDRNETGWKAIPLSGGESVIIHSDRPVFLLITPTSEGLWAGHLTVPADEVPDEEVQHLTKTSTGRDDIMSWAEEHIDAVDGISIPVGQ
jgi:hypothetical protein